MNFNAEKKAAPARWRTDKFQIDPLLITVVALLLALGFVMVCSTSLHLGEKLANDSFYYPKHQLIHIMLGVIAASVVRFFPMVFWEKTGQPFFLIGLLLLILVLIPGLGVQVNGSMRWLSIIGVRVQVSEMVKLISIIYMAGFLTRHSEIVRTSVNGMIRPLTLLSVASVLLLMEPDFGTAAILLMTALLMMFIAGARIWQFVLLIFLIMGLAFILIFTSPYRMARVLAFLDPWADPMNSGFQLTQALIAFGRGEWLGVGIGSGIQKLFYLPEAHTDFIYSVIAEELGLVGAVTVIVLFTVLVWRAFAIAHEADLTGDKFAAYLASGLGIWFGLQAFINMGVNMGMLPTKGLTLPLISYGGGSMIVMCVAVALLARVHSEAVQASRETPKGKPEWLLG